ncbi:unnamed protein product [Hydatigera taeniaeformis]|uniref:Uncharacterized protein n=1 Tax=Hydatigena taeniaeformis TaxID=6205 RepID=A0A3P7HAN4_HYDTA|nr:unnamed protein product [Hydatigera taeniaeformis]
MQKIGLPGRGDVCFLSPINVIYLFIPSLLVMDKFTTLDVLLRAELSPGFPDLFPDSTFDKLSKICESKGMSLVMGVIRYAVTCGLKVLRLCEEKLLDWLNDNFKHICEAAHSIASRRFMRHLENMLSCSGCDCNNAAFSVDNPTEGNALTSSDVDSSVLKRLAFQFVADKLPRQLVDKLFTSLCLDSLPTAEGGIDQTEDCGKPKVFRATMTHNNASKALWTSSTTAKPLVTKFSDQNKRMKMAKGTKSIMSFFRRT